MDNGTFQKQIEALWERRDNLSSSAGQEEKAIIERVLLALDHGKLRVAEPSENGWIIHEWVKKAILLSFRVNDNKVMIDAAPFGYDKVPLKFNRWTEKDFAQAGFRVVPGAVVRRSAFIAPGVVLMPSFVNVGARVDSGTMIDTWSTVGSCAQIGKNCHISGGVGIGGVLEPLQAAPVIIEDDCFIGARSEIAEGVIVERGSVISMGVFIGASTKIIDRKTGEIFMGRVPAYSVVIPGVMPAKNTAENGEPSPGLACAVIVKRVDERTRSKTSINELLRD
ncbi:2,3,4,5-tetrahydropyridine-2,6-dicarboxylate N-succinyltransferase [Entomobacter blattae]|uniref:2,3,4,5-tetrahydropyridine-2,6-dicarboxylate N-succinyltransferase n=1 Tax=Entomobacter blattae TaxID=2762277 RepID=A0A7H1NSM5_9PROT|nr:2,3,4,5-tetrahydropyridine-2,6-dicarboxylate N-succinyltransferase [Entomobacter blattae]QNT78785.1 2,3,4,5-tetrahydropyridine-2,6-dicarboxylate N-succinyltransferase [Entomobacter blattae]